MLCAGSYFVLSMLDRLWHPDLTLEEAQQLMERGIEEARMHLLRALFSLLNICESHSCQGPGAWQCSPSAHHLSCR